MTPLWKTLTLLHALAVLIFAGPVAAMVLAEWWPLVLGLAYFGLVVIVMTAIDAVKDAREEKENRSKAVEREAALEAARQSWESRRKTEGQA